MILPAELLDEMHSFFLAYKINQSDYEEYFSDNRKSIKLLVDTVIEQLVEGLAGKKPVNTQHARLLINDALADDLIAPDSISTCQALNAVLGEYRILETKDYIEYEGGIRKFIRGSLTGFCQAIAASPAIADEVPALRLAAVVRSIPDV